MGLDDVFSTESAFVAAATAAVFSPKTRETIRRGAVVGVAGAMRAGDVVVGAAKGAVRGVRGEPSGSTRASGSSASRSGPTSSRSAGTGRSRSSSGTRRSSGQSTSRSRN